MGAACTKAGREEAAFLKAAKDGDCQQVQAAILQHVEWGYEAQTWNGQNVFHLAARYGRLDVLETITEAVRFNPAGPEKWKKLLRLGHSTDAILRAFASLSDVRSQTPLHLACIYGHAEVAAALLALGASPWAWDELGGRTPLHYAASMGHVDVVRVLLSDPAPPPPGDALRKPNTHRTRLVDICNDSGYTPLHYAVWAGNAAAIRALTSYDASLSARNVAAGSDWVVSPLKATPLHLAAHKGSAPLCKMLLVAYVQSQPITVDAPPTHDRRRRDPRRHANINHELPYHVAVSRGHNHLAEMLHPDVPLSFILGEAEMEAAARLYGVPKLTVIASKALQAKLLSEIEASVKVAAAIGAGGGGANGLRSAGRQRSGNMATLSGVVAAAAVAGQTASGAAAAGGAASAHNVLAAAAAKLRAASAVGDRSAAAAADAAFAAAAAAAVAADGGASGNTSIRASGRAATVAAAILAQEAGRWSARASMDSQAAAAASSAAAGAAPAASPLGGPGASAGTAPGSGIGTPVGGHRVAAAMLPPVGSSTASGTDSQEHFAVETAMDIATRPRPLETAAVLPLPPAPITPFLQPAPSGAAAGPGGTGLITTFNEAASAFALFAAEPFDADGQLARGGGGAAASGTAGAAAGAAAASGGGAAAGAAGGVVVGGGERQLLSTGSTSVSLAVLARSNMEGGTGSRRELNHSGSTSITLAQLARAEHQSRKGLPRALRGLLRSRDSARAASRGRNRDDGPPGPQGDDLDDILYAMQPRHGATDVEDNDSDSSSAASLVRLPPTAAPPSAATSAAPPTPRSRRGTDSPRRSADPLRRSVDVAAPSAALPRRMRGGALAFWRRASGANSMNGSLMQAAVAAGVADAGDAAAGRLPPRASMGDVPSRAVATDAGGSGLRTPRGINVTAASPVRSPLASTRPSHDVPRPRLLPPPPMTPPSTPAVGAASGAAAAAAAAAPGSAPPTRPNSATPHPKGSGLSSPFSQPPAADKDAAGLLAAEAVERLSRIDGNGDGGERPLFRRSISVAVLARSRTGTDDGADGPSTHGGTLSHAASLPPCAAAAAATAAAASTETAVLTMLASLVEAPQQVLRRYRLLQLTQGLDLQDLLRDHSELAAAVGAAASAAPGGGRPASGAPSRQDKMDTGSLMTTGLMTTGTWADRAAQSAADGGGGAAGAGAGPTGLIGPGPASGRIGAVLSSLETRRSGPPVSPFADDGLQGGAAAAVASMAAASIASSANGPAVSPFALAAQAEIAFATPAVASFAPSVAASRPISTGGMSIGGGAAGGGAALAGQLLRTLSSHAASESGEGMCGVCFDQPDCLSISACGHRLCADCSRELCKLNAFKPALCPFCRGYIGGFRYVRH